MAKSKDAERPTGDGALAIGGGDKSNTSSDYRTDPTESQAPGFKSPNYTQVPNELLGVKGNPGLMADMGLCELKVVLAICRQTFGFHRYKDKLSLLDLETLTGLSRQGVLNGTAEAEKRGIIKRVSEPGRGIKAEWEIIVAYEAPEKVNEVDTKGQNDRPFTDEKVNEVDTKGQRSRLHKRNNKETAEEKEITNNTGENSPPVVVADLSSSLSQWLTEHEITGKKHQAILAKNPPVEWAECYWAIAEERSDIENVAAWVVTMLETGKPPPEKKEKKKWITEADCVPPGVDPVAYRDNHKDRRPRQKSTLTLEQRYICGDPSLTPEEIDEVRRERGEIKA